MTSEESHQIRQLKDHIDRILRILEGEGKDGLVREVTQHEIILHSMEKKLDEVTHRIEMQTRLTITSLATTLITVAGAILTVLLQSHS